ncbi:hypothetical protein PNQ29_06260 [Halobacterium salinarum]|uniref:cytidylyltransferase domain-containing protein n=1 Tax=Halobacterium salinarum TaxID=2242 RepID=UPI00255486E5|nr:hypothetical protein [Halobacterium salinarum]MDL0119334.1 hypothetical protein [Halobacterium salinarum]
MDTIVSIQARLGSTRLPGKVLLPIGDYRILEWVVQRALWADTEDMDFMVAIGDNPENKAIEELCCRRSYEYMVGPEDNLLKRHLQVARSGDYDTLIRLTADCPFVPSAEITRTYSHHDASDAVYTRNDWPSDADYVMPTGTAVDVFDVELLERLAAEGAMHPNRRPLESPDKYGVEFAPNKEWGQYGDAHMAVDTPADYWRLVDAFEAVQKAPSDVAEWLSQ